MICNFINICCAYSLSFTAAVPIHQSFSIFSFSLSLSHFPQNVIIFIFVWDELAKLSSIHGSCREFFSFSYRSQSGRLNGASMSWSLLSTAWEMNSQDETASIRKIINSLRATSRARSEQQQQQRAQKTPQQNCLVTEHNSEHQRCQAEQYRWILLFRTLELQKIAISFSANTAESDFTGKTNSKSWNLNHQQSICNLKTINTAARIPLVGFRFLMQPILHHWFIC